MNVTKIRSLALAVVAGLFAVSMIVVAQHGGPHGDSHGGRHGGGKGLGPLEKLDLTDAQKEQIKALHEQFKAAHSEEFAQAEALHNQLREQRKSGEEAAAAATKEQIKTLHEGMKADHDALREQVRAVLTDEQRAELEKMHEGCKGKGHKGSREGKERKGGKGHGDEEPTVE